MERVSVLWLMLSYRDFVLESNFNFNLTLENCLGLLCVMFEPWKTSKGIHYPKGPALYCASKPVVQQSLASGLVDLGNQAE